MLTIPSLVNNFKICHSFLAIIKKVNDSKIYMYFLEFKICMLKITAIFGNCCIF